MQQLCFNLFFKLKGFHMKINHLYQIMALCIGLSSSCIILGDDSTKELLALIKSGNLKVKVDTGISGDLIKGAMEFGKETLGKVPVADTFTWNPATHRYDRTPGAGSMLTEGIGNLLTPLKDSVGNVIQGFAKDLTEWKENLYNAATYEERMIQLRKFAYYGLLSATLPATAYVVNKGVEITMDMIRAELLSPKPAILNKKQKPVYGRMDRIKRWWSGKTAQKMTFNPEIKE